jgi:hypothetical protein
MQSHTSTDRLPKAEDIVNDMCLNKQVSNGKNAALAWHVQDVSGEISLTPEHQNYLIQRHGTIDLSPLPSQDPTDPLNWRSVRVWHITPLTERTVLNVQLYLCKTETIR